MLARNNQNQTIYLLENKCLQKIQNRRKKTVGLQVHILQGYSAALYCAVTRVRSWMIGKVLISGRECYCYAMLDFAFDVHYSLFNYGLSASGTISLHRPTFKSSSNMKRSKFIKMVIYIYIYISPKITIKIKKVTLSFGQCAHKSHDSLLNHILYVWLHLAYFTTQTLPLSSLMGGLFVLT